MYPELVFTFLTAPHITHSCQLKGFAQIKAENNKGMFMYFPSKWNDKACVTVCHYYQFADSYNKIPSHMNVTNRHLSQSMHRTVLDNCVNTCLELYNDNH